MDSLVLEGFYNQCVETHRTVLNLKPKVQRSNVKYSPLQLSLMSVFTLQTGPTATFRVDRDVITSRRDRENATLLFLHTFYSEHV